MTIILKSLKNQPAALYACVVHGDCMPVFASRSNRRWRLHRTHDFGGHAGRQVADGA